VVVTSYGGIDIANVGTEDDPGGRRKEATHDVRRDTDVRRRDRDPPRDLRRSSDRVELAAVRPATKDEHEHERDREADDQRVRDDADPLERNGPERSWDVPRGNALGVDEDRSLDAGEHPERRGERGHVAERDKNAVDEPDGDSKAE